MRSASEACQHYQLKPDLISLWKAQLLEGAASVFVKEVQADPALVRAAELERLVALLSLELEVSKKASNILQAHLAKGAK